MKKISFYIICGVIIFMISFYIGMKMFSIDKNEDISEELPRETQIQTISSEEEKIGPNATLTLKIYYTKCSHTKEEKNYISEDLVNLTEEELQKEYSEWKIEKFSKNEIILTKNSDEYCDEHYVLRNTNGYITVYSIDEGNREEIYLSTDIAVEYLPEIDKNNLKTGIYIYSKEKLIEILQDFE